jgi:hypothetical protein
MLRVEGLNLGHLTLHRQLQAGKPSRCFFKTPVGRVFFSVIGNPVKNVLTLTEVEVQGLDKT